MKILVINGPNLNMLGIRQPEIYGNTDYVDLENLISAEAERLGVTVSFFQSNHEGDLVDAIQQAYFDKVDGIVINPAAYTHTSVALLDAVKSVGIPTVVDAATLCLDLLEEAGERDFDPGILRQEGAEWFVTPRNVDSEVDILARMLGLGISTALHEALSVEEVEAWTS